MADQFRYTSQYRDQLRISVRARQSKSAEKREIVIPYKQRESFRRLPAKDMHLLIIPEKQDKVHIVFDGNKKWEFIPITGETKVQEDSFVSMKLDRRLALQDSIDELLTKVRPLDKDILDAKTYKEKI